MKKQAIIDIINNVIDDFNSKWTSHDDRENGVEVYANEIIIVSEDIEFQKYLIMVGIRSLEYMYDDEIIFNNIDYFRKCQKGGLSAYKALLFLGDYIKGDYEI